MLLLFLHFIAALWLYIVYLTKEWAPPSHYEGDVFIDFFEKSFLHQYAVSFYSAGVTMYGNEISPKSDLELATITVLVLIGTLAQGTLFGELVELVYYLNENNIKK